MGDNKRDGGEERGFTLGLRGEGREGSERHGVSSDSKFSGTMCLKLKKTSICYPSCH